MAGLSARNRLLFARVGLLAVGVPVFYCFPDRFASDVSPLGLHALRAWSLTVIVLVIVPQLMTAALHISLVLDQRHRLAWLYDNVAALCGARTGIASYRGVRDALEFWATIYSVVTTCAAGMADIWAHRQGGDIPYFYWSGIALLMWALVEHTRAQADLREQSGGAVSPTPRVV